MTYEKIWSELSLSEIPFALTVEILRGLSNSVCSLLVWNTSTIRAAVSTSIRDFFFSNGFPFSLWSQNSTDFGTWYLRWSKSEKTEPRPRSQLSDTNNFFDCVCLVKFHHFSCVNVLILNPQEYGLLAQRLVLILVGGSSILQIILHGTVSRPVQQWRCN